MRQSFSPLALFRDGFDWTGRSGRLAFFLVFVTIFAVAFALWTRVLIGAPRWQLSLLLFTLALILVPFLGHVMRRLNDLGWSGLWWWVALLPGLNIALFLILTLRYGTRYQPAGGILRFCAAVVTTMLVLLLLARIFWAPYIMVAGAMKPNVLVADYVLVRLGVDAPHRGDVMAFHHPGRPQVWVSRIVGLPGDRVQMIDGILHINDQPSPQARIGEFIEIMGRQGPNAVLPRCANGAVAMGAQCRKTLTSEALAGAAPYQILNIGDQRLDHTQEVVVPEGHYFVLGDNRDNAADSRIPVAARGIGLLPQSALIGRVERIVTWALGAYLPDNWRQGNNRFWDKVE